MPGEIHTPPTRADAMLEIRRLEHLLEEALASLTRLQQRITAGDAPHEVESESLGRLVRERAPLDPESD